MHGCRNTVLLIPRELLDIMLNSKIDLIVRAVGKSINLFKVGGRAASRSLKLV